MHCHLIFQRDTNIGIAKQSVANYVNSNREKQDDGFIRNHKKCHAYTESSSERSVIVPFSSTRKKNRHQKSKNLRTMINEYVFTI